MNYRHLVFTLPEALNGWIELHPKTLYSQLFQNVWERKTISYQEDLKTALGRSCGLEYLPRYY